MKISDYTVKRTKSRFRKDSLDEEITFTAPLNSIKVGDVFEDNNGLEYYVVYANNEEGKQRCRMYLIDVGDGAPKELTELKFKLNTIKNY